MDGDHRSGCPINLTLETLGDRWSLIVIRDVMFGNRRHYRELLNQSEEGIASNILADRLVRLLDAGILTRGTAARGQRARYSLSEAGIQTVPVLLALQNWGAAWRDSPTPEGLDESGSVVELMDDLRARHLTGTAPPPPADAP